MKRVNKTMLTTLSGMMAVSMVLAGCAKSTTSETTPAPASTAAATTAATATPEAKPSAKTELVTLYYPGAEQKDVKSVEEEANKYLKDKLNATIKINAIDFGQWNDKLNLMIASGEEADIIFTAAWQNYTVNVAKGAFLPLNDLLAKNGQDIVKNLDPAFLEGSKVNGKNYGIPTNKELAATRGVLLRKDLVDKYKMDLTSVKTWKDLEPLLKTVKEKEPGITPWFIANQGNGGSSGILDNLDWDYLGDASVPGVISKTGKDTKVLNALETPEYKEAAKLIRAYYKAGYINKDAATTTVFPKDQAKAGKVFMWTDGLKPGKDAETEGYVGFKLTQLDLTVPTISTGDASGAMLAISKTSKHPDLAMKVINLLHSDKTFNNLVNFGIEGKHYVKKSETIIDLPAGKTAQDTGYNPGAQWELGNQFLNYLWTNEDPNKWQKFKDFNAKGVKSPALGFAFNSEPVKNEIAACANIANQYGPALSAGTVDPDEVIPKFLEKLKAAGVDKIIAEKQKQLDAFLAAAKK
ncbi:ABC transporter substrate-binding protein [Paenibacillus sp. HWE-109]|uniref:ABC transporter substrate-binding protein n=1 Tax=Paenibacillus sp. HWE-109 TaxID=1306526 RepID=UPI001EDCF734|nr:ABC transporter substrate-binding protein [Paenibacillus sp. HWE-109]UKS27247.1 ABC transporter substrate-binding protein [Paenibacillus sp. HWE-109]